MEISNIGQIVACMDPLGTGQMVGLPGYKLLRGGTSERVYQGIRESSGRWVISVVMSMLQSVVGACADVFYLALIHTARSAAVGTRS